MTKAAFPAIPIASCSTAGQLRDLARSVEKQVPDEMLDELISLKKVQKYNR